jgi:glucose-1-phosphate thymidylyltransferase
LQDGKLKFRGLDENTAWMDCGTVDSLNDAANYIKSIEDKLNFKIGCIEEIAYRQAWISKEQLAHLANNLGKNEYANYLKNSLELSEVRF